MSTTQTVFGRVENRLLSALPHVEYRRLLPALKPVHLVKGLVLYEPGDTIRHCYFPTGGMLSLLSITEGGGTVEVSMIGNEGVVGINAILRADKAPYRVMVQIPADALKIRADVLREEFNQIGSLHALLLRYTHALLCQIAQSAACNRFHTMEERLSRWLLISRDRVNSNTFMLTQEFLAHMLGVPRTSVTMTIGILRRKNLIRNTRGKITIIDRQGLEAGACECYRIVKEEISFFVAACRSC